MSPKHFKAIEPFLGPLLTPFQAEIKDLNEALVPPQSELGKLYYSVGGDPNLGTPWAVAVAPLLPPDGQGQGWRLDHARIAQLDRAAPPPAANKSNFYLRIDAATKCDWLTKTLPDWICRRHDPYVLIAMVYQLSDAMPMRMAVGNFPVNTGARGGRNFNQELAHRTAPGRPLLPGLNTAILDAVGAPGLEEFVVPEPSEQDRVLKALSDMLMDRSVETVPLGVISLPWFVEQGQDGAIVKGLCLVLGSCQYPRGILDQLPATDAWQELNRQFYPPTGLPRPPAKNATMPAKDRPPELMLLVGDQIYADATAGLFDPSQLDDRYRSPYQTWLGDARVRSGLRRTVMLAVPDDHEFDDCWEPIASSPDSSAYSRNLGYLRQGLRNFIIYQRPNLRVSEEVMRVARRRVTEIARRPLYYSLTVNQVPMFLLDTRTRRDRRQAEDLLAVSLLDRNLSKPPPTEPDRQWKALKAWLDDAQEKFPDHPKLIVSPSILLPRHRYAAPAHLANGDQEASWAALRSDTWDGFPRSLHRLLAYLVDQQIQKVVFLSGDEHLGLSCKAVIRNLSSKKELTIHSLHSPGLYAPFPFANGRGSEFILNESFGFSDSDQGGQTNYQCEVRSSVVPSRGFLKISLTPGDQGRWTLESEALGTGSNRSFFYRAVL